jgi:hypothetical protein
LSDTAKFLSDALDRAGGYHAAFGAFLKDSGNAERQSATSIDGLPWKMSLNMRAVLEEAANTATRVSGSSEIHARHLLAALLITPETAGPLVARARLQDLNIALPSLLGEFRDFLRTAVRSDNQTEWDAILGTTQLHAREDSSAAPREFTQEEAREALALDEKAMEFLQRVCAVARKIGQQADSFAALALLMGWAERAPDHAAHAITRALQMSQGLVTNSSTTPNDLLDLHSPYMPGVGDVAPWVKVKNELMEALKVTHGWVERMQLPGFLRFRVFLAVILSKQSLTIGYAAAMKLQKLHYRLDLVRAYYRHWLAHNRKEDVAAIYDELLGSLEESDAVLQREQSAPVSADVNLAAYRKTYSAFVPDRAAYGRRAVDAPLNDALGVGVHAGHLAQLIAAKETWMPLSIGLFGAWGAGKSHFIDLIDEHLRALSRAPGKVFHQHIVQIRFNAWHYLDTNLWANLVCEIFDQLFVKLDERPDTTTAQVDKLKGELAKQSALASEAKEALKTAENARIKAEEDLAKAMKERVAAESSVGAMLDDLTKLGISDEVKKQLNAAAEGLGLPRLQSSFAELEARAGEVRSLSGRMRAMALAIFTGPGWWKRGLLLAVAVAAPLVVALLAQHGGPWIENLFAGASGTIAQVVTAIAAISAWLTAQVKAGNALVANLESAYDKVKQVRVEREARDDAATAKTALAAKRQSEDQARHRLREAEEKMKAISSELAELAPGRQLIRFLKDRASAEDYRRHLGLVSLVRRDFEQLSRLLTKAGEEKDSSLPQIDRIVLYIDDLDRCRADRVIEVLEAVHLLLAFPLFAVVVAVDPRWLRQSLLDHYPRLLGGTDDAGANRRPRALGRPATPQDYLEKVFQVPFHLQAMEKTGFDALVKHLFPIPEATKVATTAIVGSRTIPTEKSELTTSTPTPERNEAAPQPTPLSPSGGPRRASIETASDKPKSPPPPDPQRLALTKKEVEDVQRFQPLFQTPRAVKRLANTYCLIRVGVDEGEWGNYLGSDETPGTYRLPMLLLAVTSAFPSLARPWLLWLRETAPAQWQLAKKDIGLLATKHADTTDNADWDGLGRVLDQLMLEDWANPEPELLAKWVPRVARYAF